MVIVGLQKIPSSIIWSQAVIKIIIIISKLECASDVVVPASLSVYVNVLLNFQG